MRREEVVVDGLGARVRRLRKDKGLSQEALADPHYTAAYISHVENDKRTPSQKVLEHIAERLGVSVEELVTGRDPRAELRLQIDVDRAIAQIHVGELDKAREALTAVSKQAATDGFSRARAAAEEGLAQIAQREGRMGDARHHLDTAEELLAEEAPETLTPIVTTKARSLFYDNDIYGAIHLLETHLAKLTENGSGDPTAMLQVHAALIGPYFEAGLKDRAATAAEDAFSLSAQVQDPEYLACMHINRAQILLEQGHSAEAMRSLARAEDLFTQIGWRDSATKAAIARATAAVETGDLDAGEAQVTRALRELEETPNELERARALNLLARIARLRKNPRKALEHLDAVTKLFGKNETLEKAWALREAGLCYMDLDQLELAEDHLRRSLTVYRTADVPAAIATTAAYLGDVLVKLGRAKEGAETYRSGLTRVEDLAV